MRILVLYFNLNNTKKRNTVKEHLYCFQRYNRKDCFHYFNAAIGIPAYLTWIKYDGVIIHYTFLATRWKKSFYKQWKRTIIRLKNIRGYKVAFPQDEYAGAQSLYELFNEVGVKTVYTCFSKIDIDKAYPPDKVHLDHRIQTLPGFVDDLAVKKVHSILTQNCADREIVLGYRARKLPYWLGKHGQLKFEIGKMFKEKLRQTELLFDISTDDKDVFLGESWYAFLCRCRAVLGCEGGASLLDSTGEIRKNVEEYTKIHPHASFEEVESACFPGMDYNINLFTLSPRHFECAMSRTCQVLIEGHYGGIFKPNVHYIPVKKDFSNVDEVLDKIRDKDLCRRIADNAFRDIVTSERYKYGRFTETVLEHISKLSKPIGKISFWDKIIIRIVGSYVSIRDFLDPLLAKVFYVWLVLRFFKRTAIKRLWISIVGSSPAKR